MIGDGSPGVVILAFALGAVFFMMIGFVPREDHTKVMKLFLGGVAILALIGIFAS